MSGEAGGIVLVPILAIGALPLIGAVLVGGAIIGGIGAAGRAVANYESKKRQKRQAIRQSGVYQSIGSFRQEMAANMQEQTRLNVETSERMVAVMNENRRKMAEILQSDSPDKYEKYIEIIRENSTKTTKAMAEMQESFIRNYHTKINRSVEKVSAMVSDEYKKGMEELKQLQSDRAKKQQKAKEMADRFIEEAKILLEALEKQFDGAKFSYRQMAELTKTLNESIEQYSHENYESAIATAKNVVVEVVDEIYKADCAKQEWENYYKIGLFRGEGG